MACGWTAPDSSRGFGPGWTTTRTPCRYSLHNQGVCRAAPRLVPEAWAPDGTVEAARVQGAQGFAVGVQWHPEYDWKTDALSRRLFESFGAAAGRRAAARLAMPQAVAAE